MSNSTLPDTNNNTVALIAVAWEIVLKDFSKKTPGPDKVVDAKWYADKFDEVYKQLLKTIDGK